MIALLAAFAAISLAIAAVLTLVRIITGPTLLNRIVALDVLISIIVSVLGLEAAYNRHTTTVPIMVSLGLIGFVGAVSAARFVGRDTSTGAEPDSPTTLGADS